ALTAAKEELDIRADELEKSNKYKSEFLANMSHELRTPLNSIILLSKLLSQNKNTFMNKEDVEKTVVINKAGNDLLLLINDILDLSKIEAGHMELNVTKFHSADIVKELKDLFYIVADEKNIEFIVNDEYDDILKLDKAKFLQILKNLLSNSFKFTSKGGVSVRIYKEKKNLILDIKDTGIGIKKDKLSIIFEEFKQADGSISREYGGTGLGLSICKKLIDLMDGEIKVKSESLKGSTFSIYIPLESRNDFSLSNEELKSEENNLEIYEPHILADIDVDLKGNVLDGKNILIVDDDSRNIFALMSVVENFGAESYSAMNGDEAIKLLEANEVDIDIILMDIMMPIMDGIETIKLIKSKEKFKNIPIIAVTAKTMQKDKEMCFEAGANDYLAKPIEQNALISMLKVWSNN
ncbi:MAG: ATP-binding protein, partial [Thiovulaceae bacterium]|nr:ATP-binding protein [Sulfurimonadaceae bacterium]